MTTIGQVATAMATALRTISGLDVHEELIGDVIPPAALIETPDFLEPINLPETEFETTMLVYLVLNDSDHKTAQSELRAYMSPSGPKSLRAALLADETLGGVVETLWVGSPQAVGTVVMEETEEAFYGMILPVPVWFQS